MKKEEVKDILNKLIEKFFENDLQQPFVMITPDSDEIFEFISQKIQQKLGKNYISDFLVLKDLTQKLGKKLSIKVEQDEILEIGDEKFHDLGIREVINWLNSTSVSGYKIVYIQNFQRATVAAMNAFLKTTEENFTDRLVIISVDNLANIIPTLVSRAFLLKITQDFFDNFDTANLAKIFPTKQDSTVFFQGFTKKQIKDFLSLLEAEEAVKNLKYLLDFFVLGDSKLLLETYNSLVYFSDKGFLSFVVDGIVKLLISHGKNYDKLLNLKKMIDKNLISNAYILANLI